MEFRGTSTWGRGGDGEEANNSNLQYSRHASQVRDALEASLQSSHHPSAGSGSSGFSGDSSYAGPSNPLMAGRGMEQRYPEHGGYDSEDSSGLESDFHGRQHTGGYDGYDSDQPQYDYDEDSVMGMNLSYTTSLSPSVLEYQYENGRRYHCYREGEYVLPNDEKEQDRLDLLHHVFRMILGGELHFAPVKNPKRILDLGTGTGIWAIDMADEHPGAEVIGNDLSAIQPKTVPPNVTFQIDDIESIWPYSKPFDLIHIRILAGAVTDWDALYAKAYEHCAPGGWFEATDYRMFPYCENGREDFVMRQLAGLFAQALKLIGKPADVAHLHKQGMIDAGFINVQEKIEMVPYSAWPDDKKMKLLGMYHMHSIVDSIHSYGLAPLTRILGMERVEAEVLLAAGRAEVMDTKNRFYSLLHFVIGQKPPANPDPVPAPGYVPSSAGTGIGAGAGAGTAGWASAPVFSAPSNPALNPSPPIPSSSAANPWASSSSPPVQPIAQAPLAPSPMFNAPSNPALPSTSIYNPVSSTTATVNPWATSPFEGSAPNAATMPPVSQPFSAPTSAPLLSGPSNPALLPSTSTPNPFSSTTASPWVTSSFVGSTPNTATMPSASQPFPAPPISVPLFSAPSNPAVDSSTSISSSFSSATNPWAASSSVSTVHTAASVPPAAQEPPVPASSFAWGGATSGSTSRSTSNVNKKEHQGKSWWSRR